MSDGVSFGSRESLKKSLTVARKSAENGGFKLKCYKNSDVSAAKNNLNNNNNQRQQSRQCELKMPEKLKDLVVSNFKFIFYFFCSLLNFYNFFTIDIFMLLEVEILKYKSKIIDLSFISVSNF